MVLHATGAVAVAGSGILLLPARAALAEVSHGAERVVVSNPYRVVERSPGVPTPDQGAIEVQGLAPGQSVYLQICNGLAPTTKGYDPQVDCAYANTATPADAKGDAVINTAVQSFQFEGPFHGRDPDDRFFNCLAPGDDPDGPTTAVGDQPVDPDLPSWGSSRGPSRQGGGRAPCQLRVSTEPSLYQPSDVYIPITGLSGSPGTASASSGTASSSSASDSTAVEIAVPVAVVAVAVTGGLLLRRRRRVPVGPSGRRVPRPRA